MFHVDFDCPAVLKVDVHVLIMWRKLTPQHEHRAYLILMSDPPSLSLSLLTNYKASKLLYGTSEILADVVSIVMIKFLVSKAQSF